MAHEQVYKVLFFLQSAAFILVIINYYQSSTVIFTPTRIRRPPIQVARSSEVCQCDGNETIIQSPSAMEQCRNGQDSVRGRLSNCTLQDIMRRPWVMLLTTTNMGFLDITLNMLESIRRLGLCVNTTVVAEDSKVYRYMSAQAEGDPAVHVLLTSSGEITSKEIPRTSRREYYAMFNKRQAYILHFLEQGLDVLFTDGDTFWFKDPFPYFTGEFDMSLIDSKSPYPLRTPEGDFCAGFVYYRPTAVTIQFIKAWIQTMRDNDAIGKLLADQSVMNGLLKNDKPVHVDIKPLNTDVFPYGPKFYSLLAKDPNYTPVVMHAASIRGRNAKIAKFKSSNMWLINSTIEEMVSRA